jgi:hypothetical protein
LLEHCVSVVHFSQRFLVVLQMGFAGSLQSELSAATHSTHVPEFATHTGAVALRPAQACDPPATAHPTHTLLRQKLLAGLLEHWSSDAHSTQRLPAQTGVAAAQSSLRPHDPSASVEPASLAPPAPPPLPAAPVPPDPPDALPPLPADASTASGPRHK